MTGATGATETAVEYSWEEVVNRVKTAGRPDVVRLAAQRWHTISECLDLALRNVGAMIRQISERTHWAGPSEQAMERVLEELKTRVQCQADIAEQFECELDRLADTLEREWRKIPIPDWVLDDFQRRHQTYVDTRHVDRYEDGQFWTLLEKHAGDFFPRLLDVQTYQDPDFWDQVARYGQRHLLTLSADPVTHLVATYIWPFVRYGSVANEAYRRLIGAYKSATAGDGVCLDLGGPSLPTLGRGEVDVPGVGTVTDMGYPPEQDAPGSSGSSGSAGSAGSSASWLSELMSGMPRNGTPRTNLPGIVSPGVGGSNPDPVTGGLAGFDRSGTGGGFGTGGGIGGTATGNLMTGATTPAGAGAGAVRLGGPAAGGMAGTPMGVVPTPIGAAGAVGAAAPGTLGQTGTNLFEHDREIFGPPDPDLTSGVLG